MRSIWLMMVVTALSMAGCGHPERRPAERRVPVTVQTLTVQSERVPDMYTAVGTVQAKQTATVAAKLMATIQQISVKAGDPVHAGDPLAQLDDRDIRAEYDRAKADYERYQKLFKSEAATRAEFDAVQSRYRLVETQLSYTKITAPFAGVVGQKLCEVGDLTTPGRPLFVIEQPTAFQLAAQVPDRLAGKVHVGQSVGVTVDATAEDCQGTVSEVNSVGDAASRSFLVKIDLACQRGLKSAMFGRAHLAVDEHAGLLLPKASVRERGQLTFVFVASDGRAHLRLVKPGQAIGDRVEILSGLQPGEKVVVSPSGDLADGEPIGEP